MVIILSKASSLFKRLGKGHGFNIRSYRWQILLSYIVVSLIPMSFLFITISSSLDGYFIRERKRELLSHANITGDHIAVSNFITDESKAALFAYDVDQTSKEGSFRLLVVDTKGIVVGDSNKTDIGKMMLTQEIIDALNRQDSVREGPDNIIYAAASVINREGEVVGGVLLIASSESVRNTIATIKDNYYFVSVITGTFIILLSFFLSKIILDPFKRLLSVIQKMTDGHLEQRFIIEGNNEFTEVASAFNLMAQRLERVDTSRQNFVSNVSHDLKTPLSSIKVLSESILLQEDVPVEMYKEFLTDIKDEVDRMTNIINDLLELVKMDQKEVPTKFGPVDLNVMMEMIVKRLAPIADQKDIDLSLESLKEINVVGDEVKLSLAITNLVENAIKYTQDGGRVVLTLDSDHQNAFVKVEDTGIGIEEEEQNKIFERFYRVDKTRDRQTGGTGLGLSITHAAVLLHNGSIKVSSIPGEGSVFLIRLPIAQPHAVHN